MLAILLQAYKKINEHSIRKKVSKVNYIIILLDIIIHFEKIWNEFFLQNMNFLGVILVKPISGNIDCGKYVSIFSPCVLVQYHQVCLLSVLQW